jgi:ribosomal-protein-alanine N-acetyltransferase
VSVVTPTIRPVAPNDIAVIAAIERASFADAWSAHAFTSLVARPGVVFLVADADGAVLGYAIAYFAADAAELANLAVGDAARRQGIATRLMDALAGQLRAAGVGEIWLEVRASNAAARQLYRKYGFTEAGLRKRYYDHPVEDAIVMRRDVPTR